MMRLCWLQGRVAHVFRLRTVKPSETHATHTPLGASQVFSVTLRCPGAGAMFLHGGPVHVVTEIDVYFYDKWARVLSGLQKDVRGAANRAVRAEW